MSALVSTRTQIKVLYTRTRGGQGVFLNMKMKSEEALRIHNLKDVSWAYIPVVEHWKQNPGSNPSYSKKEKEKGLCLLPITITKLFIIRKKVLLSKGFSLNHIWVCGSNTTARGLLVGLGSLLPPWWSQGSNSVHHLRAFWRAPSSCIYSRTHRLPILWLPTKGHENSLETEGRNHTMGPK